MRELLATNDSVLLSFIEALLKDAGLPVVVLDRNMSIMEGSIGVIPRRVLVETSRWHEAARILRDCDLGHWITTDHGG